jgi:hypothetical protein
MSLNPPNPCRASPFFPTTLQIRHQPAPHPPLANPSPTRPRPFLANPLQHHPQAFWKTRDSSHDLCYDNPMFNRAVISPVKPPERCPYCGSPKIATKGSRLKKG